MSRKPSLRNFVPARFPTLVAALVAGVHTLIALTHGGPVAVPDVSAYLSVAQWATGGIIPDPLHFFPGYGLLLAPVGWLSGADLHTAALILNGLFAASCVLGAASLAQSYGNSRHIGAVAALLAALHPSLSTASRIAWPETLLTASLLVIGLLLRDRSWALAGVVAGLSFAIHPRAIVIIIAISVVGGLSGRARRVIGGLTVGVSISGFCVYLTKAWPWSRVEAAISPGSGGGLAETISGQWLVFTATSGALAAVGLLMGLQKIWKGPERSSESFLALSALGMIALGGIALAGSDRADTLLYGRYVGPWVVPLTVIGLVALNSRTVTRRVVLIGSALTVIGFVVVFFSGEEQMQGARRIMTLGLGAIWSLFDNRLAPTLFFATAAALLGILCARIHLLIPVAICAVLAIGSTVSNHYHLHDVGQIADGQASTAELVPAGSSCLSHDVSTKSYALWLYRLELPEIDHQRVDISNGDKPCGRYVVATDDILTTCGNAKRLGAEPQAKWSMWLYPSMGCG